MSALGHALQEFLNSPMQVIAAVVTIMVALSATLKAGRRRWLNFLAVLRSRPIVPTETLRIVQDVNSCYWGEARSGETVGISPVFDGHVTNISDRPVRILRVDIPRPLTHSQILLVSNNHDARRSQVLSPGECAEIRVSFFIAPPPVEKGNLWRSSLIFIDQYNNRHKIKNCVFKSLMSGAPPAPKEPEEFVYEVADPVEKEVVGVLKSELSRYNVCGRVCGGLGSVHIMYRGQHLTGVGGDSWTPNSPLNQVLVADPEAASLQSDNLQALVSFYEALTTDEEKARFEDALLGRLNEKRGYLAVSYFIVATLWKIGSLAVALRKAKRDLPEGEMRLFGLSNTLMLLNGLLKFRYPDFTNEMLDEIERMTQGLKEHTFLISAKIASIRASRLRGANSD
jgi:hypothetical protein